MSYRPYRPYRQFYDEIPARKIETLTKLGRKSIQITCPNCDTEVKTDVKFEATTKTKAWSLVLCLVCCVCIVWLPFCLKCCLRGNHICPKCGQFIGTSN